MKSSKKKGKKKGNSSKPYGLRKYWPNLTFQQAESERQKLFEKQNGKCAICSKPESYFKRKLSVDHNHKTGQVRGLLCFRCNKFVVGRHDISSATRLYQYLQIERAT